MSAPLREPLTPDEVAGVCSKAVADATQLGDRGHLYARELALNATPTLKLDLDHVWTVDGEPLGIRHEFQLDGDHVIARDVGIKNGRQHGAAHERRIPLIQAVHVVLNATAAELEAIENRLGGAPGTDDRCPGCGVFEGEFCQDDCKVGA